MKNVLEIPDEYKCMDPELVEILEDSVGACLGLFRYQRIAFSALGAVREGGY